MWATVRALVCGMGAGSWGSALESVVESRTDESDGVESEDGKRGGQAHDQEGLLQTEEADRGHLKPRSREQNTTVRNKFTPVHSLRVRSWRKEQKERGHLAPQGEISTGNPNCTVTLPPETPEDRVPKATLEKPRASRTAMELQVLY